MKNVANEMSRDVYNKQFYISIAINCIYYDEQNLVTIIENSMWSHYHDYCRLQLCMEKRSVNTDTHTATYIHTAAQTLCLKSKPIFYCNTRSF